MYSIQYFNMIERFVMIPKVIHYCWFGGKQKPDSVLRCLESWRLYCPDYDIIEWNEKNFDILCCPYVTEAYEAKKWAFVTDYVRLWVLYNYGGVYMDTDVEVIGNIDKFLYNNAFSGFENDRYVPTGIMGSVKNNKWIKINLEYYKNRNFKLKNGNCDLTTNVITIFTLTTKNYMLRLDYTFQDLGDVVFYPRDYFCPKDHSTKILEYLTINTVTIHHFDGSWLSEDERRRDEFISKIRRRYGSFGAMLVFNLYVFRNCLMNKGLLASFKLLINKIKNKMFF